MLASCARSSAVIIGGFGCGIPASSSRSKLSVRLGNPGAALARRRRLERPADLIAAPLALEVVGLGAVRDLELQMVAAHESFDWRRAEARLTDIELAVQEAVGLRTQSEIHLRIAAAAKAADRAARDRGLKHTARRR